MLSGSQPPSAVLPFLKTLGLLNLHSPLAPALQSCLADSLPAVLVPPVRLVATPQGFSLVAAACSYAHDDVFIFYVVQDMEWRRIVFINIDITIPILP